MSSYTRHSCQWWARSAQHRVILTLQLRAFLSSPPPARASVSSCARRIFHGDLCSPTQFVRGSRSYQSATGTHRSLIWRVPIPNRYTAKAKLCFCKNNKRRIIICGDPRSPPKIGDPPMTQRGPRVDLRPRPWAAKRGVRAYVQSAQSRLVCGCEMKESTERSGGEI
jgi:hypothetical protein